MIGRLGHTLTDQEEHDEPQNHIDRCGLPGCCPHRQSQAPDEISCPVHHEIGHWYSRLGRRSIPEMVPFVSCFLRSSENVDPRTRRVRILTKGLSGEGDRGASVQKDGKAS